MNHDDTVNPDDQPGGGMGQIDLTYVRKQQRKIDVLRGGRFMVEGMEYHFASFSRLHSERIQSNGHVWPNANFEPAKHEAVAYINRMGQFYYYAKSPVVRSLLGNDSVRLIPTIKKFIGFRDKQTAHRATDYPKKNDPVLLEYFDGQFSLYSHFNENRMTFEMVTEEDDLTLDLIEEHPKILGEANTLMTELGNKL